MTIQIIGLVSNPRFFTYDDLTKLPNQIPDLSVIAVGRLGIAVPLRSLLDACTLEPEAKYLTVQAEDYSASVLLDSVLPHALLVYGLGDRELPRTAGGPVRFLIPDVMACATGGVDQCANVKFLSRLVLSARIGPDTRPASPSKHATLHTG